MKQNDALIVAHRGESFEAPENTLAAIELAWKNGINAVEIDVQYTSDMEIVVIHDTDTARLSDINRIIKETKLQELKEIDVGSFKDIKWENERIPTLREVLQTIPVNGKLIIEIKSDDSIINKLVTEIKNSHLETRQIEFIAFNINVISKLKTLLPEYKMLWLLEPNYIWPFGFIYNMRTIKKVQSNRLDGVDVCASNKLTEKFVQLFKKQNLLVYVWTVNEPLKAEKLISFGVDAITTDRATWIKDNIRL